MKNVLVVDTNVEALTKIHATLSKAGYITWISTSTDTAIQVMTDDEQEMDIVLLSVNMPETNGWEAIQIIKDEFNGWPNTEVIMIGSSKKPETALKAWNLGAASYLKKPFTKKSLLETVEQASKSIDARQVVH